MAENRGFTSNSEALFEELARWNKEIKAIAPELRP